MVWTIEKKTTPQALAEAELVFKGTTGVRLKDERGFGNQSDSLNKIKDNPSAVVDLLGFDCYAPGLGDVIRTECPVPGCTQMFGFNRKAPHPSKCPSRLASLTADL